MYIAVNPNKLRDAWTTLGATQSGVRCGVGGVKEVKVFKKYTLTSYKNKPGEGKYSPGNAVGNSVITACGVRWPPDL